MFGRVIYADQNVYIGGHKLSGVTSFQGDYQIPLENIDTIGCVGINPNINGPLTRTISMTRHIVSADPLLYLTGQSGVNGHIIYKNNYFGFVSGYLNTYKVNASVGELTKVDTSFVIFNNIGGNVIDNEPVLNDQLPFTPANPGDISLNFQESATNRVTSFEYTIDCTRKPQYVLGSFNPAFVVLKRPLPVTLNFTVELDDYLCKDIQTLICSPYQQNLVINLNKCDKSTLIQSYSISNASLISNSYNSSLSENANVKLTYRGYII